MPPTEVDPEDETYENSVVIEITDNLSENQDKCVKEISQVYKNIIDIVDLIKMIIYLHQNIHLFLKI